MLRLFFFLGLLLQIITYQRGYGNIMPYNWLSYRICSLPWRYRIYDDCLGVIDYVRGGQLSLLSFYRSQRHRRDPVNGATKWFVRIFINYGTFGLPASMFRIWHVPRIIQPRIKFSQVGQRVEAAGFRFLFSHRRFSYVNHSSLAFSIDECPFESEIIFV